MEQSCFFYIKYRHIGYHSTQNEAEKRTVLLEHAGVIQSGENSKKLKISIKCQKSGQPEVF